MRVLDRPTMSREPGPDGVRRSVESKSDEPRMTQDGLDIRREGSEDQPIAWRQQRRRWTVFRAAAPVALAEDDGGKPMDVGGAERCPPGETDLDRRSRRQMDAGKAGRQGRRVVGDHEIARAQELDEIRAQAVPDAPGPIDRQKLRISRALDRLTGAKHPGASCRGARDERRPRQSLDN